MMMTVPLCTRPTPLIGFLYCKLTEITVRGYTCRPTRTHYPDSEPTSLIGKVTNTNFLALVLSDRVSNPRFTALEASTLTITLFKYNSQ